LPLFGEIMSSINSFIRSGFWDYKNTIVPVAVATPLIVEGVAAAKNIYKRPSFVVEKMREVKKNLLDAFTPRKDELTADAVKRIAKNIFTALACIGLMAAAGYIALHFLPSAIAISTAITAIYLIGKLFLNAASYKKQLIEAFTAKPNETPQETRKRVMKNVAKAALIAFTAIATIIIGGYVLSPLITKGFSWGVSLPFQTKAVVFLEYAFLGLIHGCLAYSKYRKGDKSGALFHLIAAVMSIVFPSVYMGDAVTRLHHSFYGLALMALPFRTTKFIGSMITFDSALYFSGIARGYQTIDVDGKPVLHQYDFINSIVDNFPLFVNTYAGATIANDLNKAWAKGIKIAEERDAKIVHTPSKPPETLPAVQPTRIDADPVPPRNWYSWAGRLGSYTMQKAGEYCPERLKNLMHKIDPRETITNSFSRIYGLINLSGQA
jgi:hypothetical protein